MRSLDIASPQQEDPFGAIGSAPTNAKAGAKTYPLLPGDHAGKVDQLYDAQQRKKSAEATEKAIKSDLATVCRRYWMRHCSGKTGDLPSSIEVKSETRSTKVSLKNSYPKIPVGDPRAADLAAVFGGGERMLLFLRRQTSLKIAVDKIPQDRINAIGRIIVKLFSASAEELDDMALVMDSFEPQGPGCPDAIVRDTILTANDAFHTARHRDLTIATNRAIDTVYPFVASVGQVK